MITKETLETRLREATDTLLNMARESSWNAISNHCRYILSAIKFEQFNNVFAERKIRIAENNKKEPVSLADIMPALLDMYSNLYDINLYIHLAKKKLTIIDIRYFPKSLQEEDYRKTIANNPPMLHCKVAIPPYAHELNLPKPQQRFDINWEHNPWHHQWKMFWWRSKTQ
ncbi:hypothetical protein HB364_27130 [Pseudoflavitalea sp. X16]|uniref:hypothetical protein n=1 Tax=Paraflavitalea devenefica TaxID=2716334 RepID=UPI001421F72F|nr:hypothetical protein [Paraflavitalea devenefica]NII28785.1 hypothetical protein [Paraflavitalea devenefica]